MKVLVNGQEREFDAPLTVLRLLEILDAPERGVAVAINSTVIPGGAWNIEPIKDGDRVEVLTAVQGG